MSEMVNVNIRIDKNLALEMKKMAKNLWLNFSNFTSLLFNKTRKEWKLEIELSTEENWYDKPGFYEEIIEWDKPENYSKFDIDDFMKKNNLTEVDLKSIKI